ncbi:MAG TPA: hypothetical protein VMH30_13310 [Verrucomicrobiae bacterium]|nr:hypothetical protein [Verrucomicrobiae bacterium]
MKHILKFLAVTAMFLTAAGTAFCDTAQDYVNSGVDKDVAQNYDGAIADYTKYLELYAGSKYLFAGDKTAARDLFTKCVATGQNDLDEYDSAAAELKLLPAETPSPSPSK